MSTWRLSNGAVAVFEVPASSTVQDVHDALGRLESTGHARRNGPLFTAVRWMLTAAPEEDRKRA